MFSLRDFPVTVRRKNSEIESVYLGEISDIKLFCCKLWNLFPGAELERFVDSDFPQWNESWITTGFEFDIKRLGNIEGIIEPEPLVSKRQINREKLFYLLQVWAASQNLTLQDGKKGESSKKSKTMSHAMWMREGQGQLGKKKEQYHKVKSIFYIL